MRFVSIILSLCPIVLNAQSVVIDVEYRPNTTYEWARSTVHEMTVEYLGAENMGDWFSRMGIEPYSETHRENFIKVRMITSTLDNRQLGYQLTIDSLTNHTVNSNPRDQARSISPIEIDDINIFGVVNRFQKIEIDSIQGVDSLYEKNRVFKLLDDIHRSWSYPKDTLMVGHILKRTVSFDIDYFYTSAQLTTSYLLEKIENGVAFIQLEYLVTTEVNDDADGLLTETKAIGSGTGQILYDLDLKQVSLLENKMSIKSFRDAMNLSIESTTTSNYRWTMNVIK